MIHIDRRSVKIENRFNNFKMIAQLHFFLPTSISFGNVHCTRRLNVVHFYVGLFDSVLNQRVIRIFIRLLQKK